MSTRIEALTCLSRDHHQGLVMSHRLQRYVAQYSKNPNLVAALTKVVVGFFDQELVRHFTEEEEILFPAMEQYLGELPFIDELREEHQRMRSLVEQFRKHQSGVRIDDLQEFAELLEHHIRKEERSLSKMFEETMPEETIEVLTTQLKRAERIARKIERG